MMSELSNTIYHNAHLKFAGDLGMMADGLIIIPRAGQDVRSL
jgi:hypothetical protein